MVVPLELQERNISHFLWHTGFFIQFISFIILPYWWLLSAGTRTPFAQPPHQTKVLGGEREGIGEGKGKLSPERFPVPSPSFPLRALHNGVKRGDGKGAAAAPPFKDDLGNVTLGENFL